MNNCTLILKYYAIVPFKKKMEKRSKSSKAYNESIANAKVFLANRIETENQVIYFALKISAYFHLRFISIILKLHIGFILSSLTPTKHAWNRFHACGQFWIQWCKISLFLLRLLKNRQPTNLMVDKKIDVRLLFGCVRKKDKANTFLDAIALNGTVGDAQNDNNRIMMVVQVFVNVHKIIMQQIVISTPNTHI